VEIIPAAGEGTICVIGDRFRQRISPLIGGGEEAAASRKSFSACAIEYSVRFALGLTLSGARIFDTLSPFAVGLTAASGSAGAAVATALGSVAGYLLFGSLIWAVQYIAAASLICTILIVFRERQIYENAWFMPVSAAVITACIGFVTAAGAGAGRGPAAGILVITDVALVGGCAYFYKRALSPWSGNFKYEHNAESVHAVSVLILLSTLLIALSNVTILGVLSAGRSIAVLAVFLASYMGGAGMGCAAGVAIGLAMDASSGGAPMFAAAYGVSGLVSGVFAKRGRLSFAVSFVLVGAAAAVMSIGSTGVPSMLYEAFVASVIFLILPGSFMSRLGALLPRVSGGAGAGALRSREYTKDRIEEASLAFRDLYETVKEKTGVERNDADIATLFDRAAETVCRRCLRSPACWQSDYQTTLDVMNNLAPKMLERGSLTESDFPDYFSCVNLRNFTASVNAELRGMLYRRQYRSRLRENQNAAFNQYSEVSSILSEISHELGGGIELEPKLEERLAKYLQSLGLTAECAVFRARGGRMRAEIYGTEAAAQLTRDDGYLDKLSAALGVRLCTADKKKQPPDKLVFLEAEPLCASVGISCMKKSGQEVSGDKGAYFKTDEGILFVILSDGMGTGELAARYSGDAVRILERFLRSGVAAKTAVRMLGDLFLLKNEDDTGCATVDLISINLFTGATSMFKYGAAPTYLRGDDTIRRVRGKSLAAGLGAPPFNVPDHVKMELKPGSLAVMVSDGVTTGADDGWLEDAIMDYSGARPRDLSRAIIKEAAKKSKGDDDMTAIAIQVSRRE